jgi:hypothetical protein
MIVIRGSARALAYFGVILLGLVWITSGLVSMQSSFYDIAGMHVGDAILRVAGLLGLGPAGAILLAKALTATKLAIGTALLSVPVCAVYESLRRGRDDDMMNIGLMLSAVGTVIAGIPVLIHGGGIALQAVIGELLICVIVAELAAYSRRVTAAADVA